MDASVRASQSAELEDDIWGDDIWGEDDDDGVGHSSQADTDLQREWEARRNQFHTLGFRDGISAGKESEAQVGFNIGFKEAVVAGYNWGVARGAASAFAAMGPSLKKLLLKDKDATKRLESLNTSISSISSNDAMRTFYEESILQKETAGSEEEPQNGTAGDTNSVLTPPQSENQSNGCCGGRGLQRLVLDPEADDKPTRSDETCEADPYCCRSNFDSSSIDERNKTNTSSSDESETSRPNLPPAQDVGTSDVNKPSRHYNRLELLQGKVEVELRASVVKLSAFPV